MQFLTSASLGFAADYQRSLSVPISIFVEDTDSYSGSVDLSSSLDLRRPQCILRAAEISESPPSTNSFLPWVPFLLSRRWQIYLLLFYMILNEWQTTLRFQSGETTSCVQPLQKHSNGNLIDLIKIDMRQMFRIHLHFSAFVWDEPHLNKTNIWPLLKRHALHYVYITCYARFWVTVAASQVLLERNTNLTFIFIHTFSCTNVSSSSKVINMANVSIHKWI